MKTVRMVHFHRILVPQSAVEFILSQIVIADTKHGVVETLRIADFTAWPSHDNRFDRFDFGNSDVEVITTHFN